MNETQLITVLNDCDIGLFRLEKQNGKIFLELSDVIQKKLSLDKNIVPLNDFSNKIQTNCQNIEEYVENSLTNGTSINIDFKQNNKSFNMNGKSYLQNKSYYIIGGIKETKNQDDYLIHLFHEIRNPINAILSMIYLLNKTELNSIQRDYLCKTNKSVKTLALLTDNILDYSKIKSGKIEIEYSRFSLKHLIDDIYDLIHCQIMQKELDFEIKISSEIDQILIGDPLKLKQVLLNLASNSIKFTKQGFIKLEITQQYRDENKTRLLFAFEDTGIGLNKSEINTLFDPFTQANTSIKHKYGGTGLGLAISKNLVNLMGGDIWCDSIPHSGTVFRFTADFLIPIDENLDIENNQTNLYVLPKFLHNKKLLLVEDDEINQILTKEILTIEGFKVDIATTGIEAIEMAQNEIYDLIIMDIHIPEIDGVSVIKEIRSQKQYSEIPIIVLTANSLDKYKKSCFEVGINDYLIKPINPFELYKCIERWLTNE